MITGKTNIQAVKIGIILLSVLIICVIPLYVPVASASVISEGRSGATVGELYVYGSKRFKAEYVKITVDLNSLPLDKKGNYNESYDGRVTIESSLYNPYEQDSSVKIYFYEKVAGYGDESRDRKVYLDDELLPQRRSYVLGTGNTVASEKYIEAVTGISDAGAAISPDEKVYVYRYYISVPDDAEEKVLCLTGYDGGFPVIAKGAKAVTYVKDGADKDFYEIEAGDKNMVTVASVGEPLNVADWKAAKSLGDAYDGNYYDGAVAENSCVETSYATYVKESLNCPDEAKDDLYACVTTYLDGADFVEEDKIFSSRSYTCISIVDVTVPAGERVVFRTDEKLFPGVMKNYSPPVYVIDVEAPFFNIKSSDFYAETTITTPYRMIESNYKLKNVGISYIYRNEKYATNDLSVQICESADPESLPNDTQTAFLTLLYLMMASPTVAVVVIVVLLVAVILLAVLITALVRKLIKLFRKRSED